MNCKIKDKNQQTWGSELAQQGKAFAAKSADLSLIPRTHKVEEENSFLQVVFWPPHVHV